MSYILDALKKSERDRTLVRGVGFADAARQVVRGTDWLPWIIGAIVVVTVILVVTVYVVRDRLVPIASAPRPATGVSTPAAAPKDASEPKPAAVSAEARAPQALAGQAPFAPPLIDAKVESAAPPVEAGGEAIFFAELPAEFQQGVPAMAVNIHVYAPEESQRILYINNTQYYRGDQIPGGVTVEEIVPEGVVLQFRGQRFKLPRPS